MSGSGVLREKKQESVQFWLAIGAVSLLFHALLIVGLKRWVTIAVVDESEPISVEFVDSSSDAAPEGEPIVQAAAMKPEAKSEVKPEPEPEIKAEVKPEPIVKPEVKKVEPAIVPKEKRKPKVVVNPSQTEGNDRPPRRGQNNTVPPEDGSNPPATSKDPLISPNAGKGIKSVISRAGGEPMARNVGSFQGTVKKGATMAIPIFTTSPASEETLPTNFPLPLNKSIRLIVNFCVDSEGNADEVCDPTLDVKTMNEVVQTLNLTSSQRDQLDIFVSRLIQSTKFPKPSLGIDGNDQMKDSEWSVVLEITGQ